MRRHDRSEEGDDKDTLFFEDRIVVPIISMPSKDLVPFDEEYVIPSESDEENPSAASSEQLDEEIMHDICRGVDTADVLKKGLSRRAIALGSLKGLIGTKDMREFLY